VEAEQPKTPESTTQTWKERIAGHRLRLAERIRAERELHSSVDVTLTGIERDSDVGGGIMAGALAYRLFIWLLPFALVLVGVLGVVSKVTGEVPREAVAGTGLAGLVTKSVAAAASGAGYWYALAVGLPVLVYMTRSLLRALIVVHRLVWTEHRERVPKPTWTATLQLLVVLVALFVVVPVTDELWPFPGDAIVVPVIDAILIALLWLAVICRLPRRDAGWQSLLPGAVLFGVGAVLIGSLTYNLLGAYASQRESTYGALGLAAALLLGLFIVARLVVACAVLNATLWERRTAEK
jgi:uncharacterized BrkB/YihY/UPF0761 family membrane protein